MRVISQDGENDVPYEKTYVSIFYNNNRQIIAFDTLVGNDYLTMAEYSTEEKAIKAMEMLREEYRNYATAKSDDYWFAFNYPKVFKFPQDDEIEV
jgi:hypothetical protein